jgi:protein involved in polysaccharide export with SLBB domain
MMGFNQNKFLKLLLVVFVFTVPASSLEAQGLNLLDKMRSELADIPVSPQQSRLPSGEERIPLEGKIDRSSYRLGPGDEVDVSVWGAEMYESSQLVVSAEGRLLVSLAGPVDVDGLTIEEAEDRLVQRMMEYFSGARITLTLINPRIFRVYAVGAIHRTGTYYMSAVDRVSDLLVEAEGVRQGGSQRRIRLLDSERRHFKTVDMMRYRMQGDLRENPLLIDGCIVEIPPLENYVLLRGSFANLSGSDTVMLNDKLNDQITEFVVEYLPGESLSDLLGLVGGPDLIETVAEGRLVLGRQRQNPQSWVPLSKDIVEKPLEQQAVYEFPVRNKWVFVSGNVKLPGRFLYHPGWTAWDYLGMAGGPDMNGSGKTFSIKRSDGSQFKSKEGVEVMPGDVIYVPQRFKLYEWASVVSFVTTLIWIFAR